MNLSNVFDVDENDVVIDNETGEELVEVDLDEYDTNLEYGDELARRGIVLYLNY